MGSYTKIGVNDTRRIMDLYDLGEVVSLIPLSLGISNSNYQLRMTTGDYLLKISNDKDSDELEEEMKILRLLAEKGFPYSLTPIQTANQKLVYQVEQYFGVVFPFIQGIPPGPSDSTCRMIGEGLALLHSIEWSENDQEKIRDYKVIGYGPDELSEYIKRPNCPEDFKIEFDKAFPHQLQEWKEAGLPRGLIHGDLYYDNTLFDNNKLRIMLDFEQSGFGELLLDLGICISGTCLEKGRIITPLIESFLIGYESVRKLSTLEREFLDQSIQLGLFSVALWRIKRFTEGNLDTLMADSYRDLLQRATNYRKESGGDSRK